jgi:hypothetical protein
MHPLDISTIFSSTRSSTASPTLPPVFTSSASMFTSLMSLTITATRLPSRLARMWLSSVVLPAPRKPDKTVTGSFSGSGERLPAMAVAAELMMFFNVLMNGSQFSEWVDGVRG